MHDLVKIEGEKFLIRDMHSKALLNTNLDEINTYERQKTMIQNNQKIAEEVESLKQDMITIKNLLLQLLNKND